MSSEEPEADVEPTNEPSPMQSGGELPPLGGDMGSEGAVEGPEPAPEGDMWFGLRNSDPMDALAQARGEADLDASWHDHFMAGVIKQTGSTGLEAWMHYAIAAFLLYQDMNETGGSEPEGHEEYHEADAGEPEDALGDGAGMSPDEFL